MPRPASASTKTPQKTASAPPPPARATGERAGGRADGVAAAPLAAPGAKGAGLDGAASSSTTTRARDGASLPPPSMAASPREGSRPRGRPRGPFTQHRRIDALRALLQRHPKGLTI